MLNNELNKIGSDIYLNKNELEKLINKLETTNKIIIDAMDYIYLTMIKIDDNDWHSPEKERINNNFIPYLKEQENITANELLSNIQVLKNALARYRENDENKLTKETENLEVL